MNVAQHHVNYDTSIVCALGSYVVKRTNKENISDLRRINEIVLPVNYAKKVYDQIVHFNRFSYIVYDGDRPIAAVGCRLEEKDLSKYKLNIMTLSVLEEYRRQGIGTALVKLIVASCKGITKIAEVYLNVQISNLEAVKLYESLGFAVTHRIENYYKKLEPSACYMLNKKL
jgi:ribosomal-protein-alanine N-acetyltransferase